MAQNVGLKLFKTSAFSRCTCISWWSLMRSCAAEQRWFCAYLIYILCFFKGCRFKVANVKSLKLMPMFWESHLLWFSVLLKIIKLKFLNNEECESMVFWGKKRPCCWAKGTVINMIINRWLTFHLLTWHG